MDPLQTNEYAVATFECEGLEYAVRSYIGGDAFKDPVTAALWTVAAKSLDALVAYLEADTGVRIG